mmetsp:Transcript_130382/g.260096  ORF Transcript_130382/g.260096 Transcript_130382/m.260096 type:complete len:275 (-) Transcript_130382:84-908(-)
MAQVADQNAETTDNTGDDVNEAEPRQFATFPVGDWFLGPGDGGVGRSTEKPPAGRLPDPNSGQVAQPTEESAAKGFSEESNGSTPSAAEQAAAAGVKLKKLPDPGYGYNGELQLLEDHRSASLTFSDLTDSARFACLEGPKGGEARETADEHPQLEFNRPHQFVHVHLEDKAAGPAGRVLWDGIYDMGGTEVLKASAEPLGGSRPQFEKICPPLHGPPHWYELTVSQENRVPGARFRMMEGFIGSQVVESYRPDHDPELDAFLSKMSASKCVLQ